MTNTGIVKNAGWLVLLVLAFAQCATYEEGGALNKASENLLGSYSLTAYLRNGVDETSTVLISNYTEAYQSGGVLVRTYTDDEGEVDTETGNYALNEENTNLLLSDLSSIGTFSAEHSTLSTSNVTILRLDGEALWYTFDNGGDTHQFQLTKN